MSDENDGGQTPLDLQKDKQTEKNTNVLNEMSKESAGLFVVATPIGHAQDITLRALDLLKQADVILCEDTRVSQKLLNLHGISRKKMMPYHEHNAQSMRPKVLDMLRDKKSVVLISDAGTPLINDPGYKLVQACQEEGHAVSSAPGPSSVITALVLSGQPSDRFLYLGFLPNKSVARQKAIEEIKFVQATLVILESPRRVAACLADLARVLAPRSVSILRELTKKFEEVRRGDLTEMAEFYQSHEVRGEVVLVVGPPVPAEQDILNNSNLDDILKHALERLSVRDAVREIVEMTGLAKRDVYNRALELQKKS